MCKLGGHVHPCAMCSFICMSFRLHVICIWLFKFQPSKHYKLRCLAHVFARLNRVLLCCQISAIHYSLPSIQVLIFTSSPSKGLAEPPQFPTLIHLQGTHTSQEVLASFPPLSFRKFITKTQRTAHRNVIIWYQSYGLQEISISSHFCA